MKFTRPIEVTGITRIVFDRKRVWDKDTDEIWTAKNDGSDAIVRMMNHKDMSERIKYVEADSRFRMWIHGDTLNIVRKEEKPRCPRIIRAFAELHDVLAKEGYI